ncbi:MAG: anaerobic carbon-monoxide dehydrogenase catalytic subunit, partial [Chloroflexota bacterium]
CRHCLQGPCRIDPFGEGPQLGVCGANGDVMVARGLARAIAAGTASHSGHAKHLVHTLWKWVHGEAPDYPIEDEGKLRALAARLGIAADSKTVRQLAGEVANLALEEYSERLHPSLWLEKHITPGRKALYEKLGVMLYGIDSSVSEVMHRTTYGVDQDPLNIILGGIKCALGDYVGMHIGTDLSDIIFGTPKPTATKANLGVLKKDAVNIAVHGHNPVLSDIVARVAKEMNDEARAVGAPAGVNIVGICCTGNEVLMRHGIPLVANAVAQELPIVTGVMDAIVVDYQCIMPSLADVAEGYHTKLITTMSIAKMTKATHIQFEEATGKESARQIIRMGIEAFKHRDPNKINIPQFESQGLAGFSTEAIVGALGLVNKADPLKPLIDNIVNGNILGVCLFAGCNSVKVTQDYNFMTIAKELAKNNVLLLATGCGAACFAREGLMTSEATNEYAGPGLKAVLTAVGKAAGLNAPLPLVLHMGSCVDNTRAADVAVAVANKLGVDVSQLPVVASAPEEVAEKAVSIGTWAVALGLPTHIGVIPPVLGSPAVVKILTETAKAVFGGYFIPEPDPVKASAALIGAMKERRKGLGL